MRLEEIELFMNIKKGITYIELIIVITLISIISITSFNIINFYRVNKNRILVDQCNNSIMSFINNCKQYCFYNNISGYIKFDVINNRLNFNIGTSVKRVVTIPKGIKLYSINAANGRAEINLDNRGFTSDACTISYIDLYNKFHEITISVGTSYVEIKN